jgi:hypothetical protein
MILGDFTSGNFGDYFDVIIDYIRFDQTGMFLPTSADTDSDGIPDAWEYRYFNAGGSYAQMIAALTNAVAGSDDDHDGLTNSQEYLANTDPLNKASVLLINTIQTPGGTPSEISMLMTSPQRNYTLLRATTLDTTNPWTPVDGPTIGTDGLLTLHDATATNIQAYYKVTVSVP